MKPEKTDIQCPICKFNDMETICLYSEKVLILLCSFCNEYFTTPLSSSSLKPAASDPNNSAPQELL